MTDQTTEEFVAALRADPLVADYLAHEDDLALNDDVRLWWLTEAASGKTRRRAERVLAFLKLLPFGTEEDAVPVGDLAVAMGTSYQMVVNTAHFVREHCPTVGHGIVTTRGGYVRTDVDATADAASVRRARFALTHGLISGRIDEPWIRRLEASSDPANRERAADVRWALSNLEYAVRKLVRA